MRKTIISIEEFQADVSGHIDRVEAGETLILMRDLRPFAEMVPISTGAAKRPIGLAAGEFSIADDFDDPLPEEILRLFEGRSE